MITTTPTWVQPLCRKVAHEAMQVQSKENEMSTWDAQMKPENILCTHRNQYPYFETDVLPGTDWEIEQRGPSTFYAYRWDQEDFQMAYITNTAGFDKIFPSREAALEAIKQAELEAAQ